MLRSSSDSYLKLLSLPPLHYAHSKCLKYRPIVQCHWGAWAPAQIYIKHKPNVIFCACHLSRVGIAFLPNKIKG